MTRRGWALMVGTTVLAGLSGCRTSSPSGDNVFALRSEDGQARRGRILRDQPLAASELKPPPAQIPGGLPVNDPDFPLLGQSDRKNPPSILRSGFPDDSKRESPLEPTLQPVVAEKPSPPRQEPLLEALRCALDNRPNEALEYLKNYDRQTQELFIRLLPPMALLAHKRLEALSPAEVAILHEQLQGLMVALRPRTELAIGKMCFCEWIRSYGVYKPLPESHRFQAGVAGQPGELVQLYVELHNFSSAPREAYHETRLSSTVEITDAQGKSCWRHSFNDAKQPIRSLTPLHDFFNNYSFHIPPHIAPGVYTVTIEVADETVPQQRRIARQAQRIVMRGQ